MSLTIGGPHDAFLNSDSHQTDIAFGVHRGQAPMSLTIGGPHDAFLNVDSTEQTSPLGYIGAKPL
jgi:hypothetical protein